MPPAQRDVDASQESTKAPGEESAKAPARPCPICGKPSVFTSRPFCSKRCSDVDLHRWLGGVYALPVGRDGDAEPDSPGASDASEE